MSEGVATSAVAVSARRKRTREVIKHLAWTADSTIVRKYGDISYLFGSS